MWLIAFNAHRPARSGPGCTTLVKGSIGIPTYGRDRRRQSTKGGAHREVRSVNCLDASYIGQPFHGEVCMHFAIIHDDLEFITLLVENGADCSSQHASGDFFYEQKELYFGGSAPPRS